MGLRNAVERSRHISDRRARLLDDFFQHLDDPTLENVVEALFHPTLDAGISQANDGGAFARM